MRGPRRRLPTYPTAGLVRERFVVVEGKTEIAVLDAWAATLGVDLGRSGARLVSADGASRTELLVRLVEIVLPGTPVLAVFDGDKEGIERAQVVRDALGPQVDCRILDRPTIESYYSRRATSLWLALLARRSGVPTPELPEGPISENLLQRVNFETERRSYDKVRSGKLIASLMLEAEIAQEWVGLLNQIVAPVR